MRTLAEQALDNVIDQFARPLDFLRELVQNALDAGSSRIDVSALRTDEGVRLIVADTGHGMTRPIIDTQLTRLFASHKHGDQTQIGRFGIGFASVFALRPESVVVRTGRLDEAWEVRFDAAQRFVVRAVSETVVGTTVTVDKALPADAAERLIREAEWVLSYWCEHTSRPVVFHTASSAVDPVDAPSDDPFAAFAAPRPAEHTVSQPLALDAAVQQRLDADGLTVLVGCSDTPRYAFYSHGLTLVNTEDTAVLGAFASRLEHLSIKVAGEGLAHTLTRDNVVHDDVWERSLIAATRLAEQIVPVLVEAVSTAATNGEIHADALRWLAHELAATGERRLSPHVPLFVDVTGQAHTLADVEAQEDAHAVILVGQPGCVVAEALQQQGDFVLQDTPELRALLMAFPRERTLGLLPQRRAVRTTRERYWTPQLRAPESLDAHEQLVLGELRRMSRAVGWKRVDLGDFGLAETAAAEPIVVPHPGDERLILRGTSTRFRGDAVLNRQHPVALTHLAAWRTDPVATAFAWLQASLEALDAPAALHDKLVRAVMP